MYNNVYEEYIRNVVGRYPENSRSDYYNLGNNIYDNYDNSENYRYMQMANNSYSSNNFSNDINLEECYPELYRLVYPMVQKICMMNTKTLSKELIDEMVEEVYSNFVEEEGITQININLNNEVRSSNNSINSVGNTKSNSISNNDRSENTKNVKYTSSNNSTFTTSSNESVQKLDRNSELSGENRQLRQRTPVLNDLIRILILRELLGRPGGNFRPPFGRPPQRLPQYYPNFPNRPNQGRPRENRDNLNQTQFLNYNSFPSGMFEQDVNIFEY